jgi:hypothetical protein
MSELSELATDWAELEDSLGLPVACVKHIGKDGKVALVKHPRAVRDDDDLEVTVKTRIDWKR